MLKKRIRENYSYNKRYRDSRREDGMRYMSHTKCFSKIEPCEVCDDKDIDVIAAHHVVPQFHSLGENITRETGGIMFLCQNCHKKLHRLYGGIGKVPYYGPIDREEIIETVRKTRERDKNGFPVLSNTQIDYETLSVNKRGKYIQELYLTGKMTVNDIARDFKLSGPDIRRIIKTGYAG